MVVMPAARPLSRSCVLSPIMAQAAGGMPVRAQKAVSIPASGLAPWPLS